MLKIDENSLLNSIIKDGQIVIGLVGTDSCIYSSAASSIVHGYANNNSKIYTNEDTFGSYAGGYTDEDSYIVADGNGAHAEGHVDSKSSIMASGDGAYVNGYAYNSGSIFSNGDGSHAEGMCAGYKLFSNKLYIELPTPTITNILYISITGYDEQTKVIHVKTEESHYGVQYLAVNLEDLCNSLIGNYISDETHRRSRNAKFLVTDYRDIHEHSDGNLYWAEGNLFVEGNFNNISINQYLYQIIEKNSLITTTSKGAHAKGYAYSGGSIIAKTYGANAEGYANNGSIGAFGDGAHAEGYVYSGGSIISEGKGAHAEGYVSGGSYIDASGNGAHAEGHAWYSTAASEPRPVIADGNGAHAEGVATLAIGISAHAEGTECFAHHNYSHAGGLSTRTDASCQTVIGKYNASTNSEALFVVGNGTNFNDSARNNAFVVYENGSYRANNMVTLDLSGSSNEYILLDTLITQNEHSLSLIRKYAQKFLISKVNADNTLVDYHGLYFSSDAFLAGDEITIIHCPTNSIDTDLLIYCYDAPSSRVSLDDASINLSKNLAVRILFTNETKLIYVPRGNIRKFVYYTYTGKFE